MLPFEEWYGRGNVWGGKGNWLTVRQYTPPFHNCLASFFTLPEIVSHLFLSIPHYYFPIFQLSNFVPYTIYLNSFSFPNSMRRQKEWWIAMRWWKLWTTDTNKRNEKYYGKYKTGKDMIRWRNSMKRLETQSRRIQEVLEYWRMATNSAAICTIKTGTPSFSNFFDSLGLQWYSVRQ